MKQSLEASNKDRISSEDFEKTCLDAGVRGKTSQEVLVSFLHDLGAVIHFDDFTVRDHHVLNPKWVTGAVYRIINDSTVAKANGLLKLDNLKEILAWQEGDEHRYYPGDHHYIIKLMQKFELCYGLLTLSDCDHNQGENDKAYEHDIQFVKPGEDAAESLQPPEQPLDFIALFIQFLVIFPRFCPVAFRRHDRRKAQL